MEAYAERIPEILETPIGDLTEDWPHRFESDQLPLTELTTFPFPAVDYGFERHRMPRDRFRDLMRLYQNARLDQGGEGFIPRKATYASSYAVDEAAGEVTLYFNLTVQGEGLGATEGCSFVILPFTMHFDAQASSEHFTSAAEGETRAVYRYPATDEHYDAADLNRRFTAWLAASFRTQTDDPATLHALLREIYHAKLYQEAIGVHEGRIAFFPSRLTSYHASEERVYLWPDHITPVAEIRPEDGVDLRYPYEETLRDRLPFYREDADGYLIRWATDEPVPTEETSFDEPYLDPTAVPAAIEEAARTWVGDYRSLGAPALLTEEYEGPQLKRAYYLWIPRDPEQTVRIHTPVRRYLNGDHTTLTWQTSMPLHDPVLIASHYAPGITEAVDGLAASFLEVDDRIVMDLNWDDGGDMLRAAMRPHLREDEIEKILADGRFVYASGDETGRSSN